jgi:hypothetical protein
MGETPSVVHDTRRKGSQMPVSARADSIHGRLRDHFPDAIVGPGDPDWDASRMAFNLLNDQRPEAAGGEHRLHVVRPLGEVEVPADVRSMVVSTKPRPR